jgi:bifunctional non-homologous end joining protein LigD
VREEAAQAAPRSPWPATPAHQQPGRVIDPSSGLKKIDLVRYYALVAPLMMEHLKGRPVSLVRAPDGITGELFFQKHLERYKMPGVIQLDPAIFPGHPSDAGDRATPKACWPAAQMNVIEYPHLERHEKRHRQAGPHDLRHRPGRGRGLAA